MNQNQTEKVCPRCGEGMELAVRSYPMGSVFHLHRIYADIFRCPKCRQIELSAAEEDRVVCPVCGSLHPAQEKCVICALDAAFGGTERKQLQPR